MKITKTCEIPFRFTICRTRPNFYIDFIFILILLSLLYILICLLSNISISLPPSSLLTPSLLWLLHIVFLLLFFYWFIRIISYGDEWTSPTKILLKWIVILSNLVWISIIDCTKRFQWISSLNKYFIFSSFVFCKYTITKRCACSVLPGV